MRASASNSNATTATASAVLTCTHHAGSRTSLTRTVPAAYATYERSRSYDTNTSTHTHTQIRTLPARMPNRKVQEPRARVRPILPLAQRVLRPPGVERHSADRRVQTRATQPTDHSPERGAPHRTPATLSVMACNPTCDGLPPYVARPCDLMFRGLTLGLVVAGPHPLDPRERTRPGLPRLVRLQRLHLHALPAGNYCCFSGCIYTRSTACHGILLAMSPYIDRYSLPGSTACQVALVLIALIGGRMCEARRGGGEYVTACVRACVSWWVHGCVGAWVHGCVRACLCAWVRACVGAFVCTACLCVYSLTHKLAAGGQRCLAQARRTPWPAEPARIRRRGTARRALDEHEPYYRGTTFRAPAETRRGSERVSRLRLSLEYTEYIV